MQIDAFELSAETPSPFQQQQKSQDVQGKSIDSPLEIRTARARQSAGASRLSRRKSSVLGRVSLGLQDALGWLHKRGSLMKTGRKSEECVYNMDKKYLDFHSVETPRKDHAEKNDGIYTITESQDAEIDADIQKIMGEIRDEHGKDPLMTPSLEDTFEEKLRIQEPVDLSSMLPIQQLLSLCGQNTDIHATMSMDDLLGKHVDLSMVKKIGEGTFGEAFAADDIVFKIVPMEGTTLINGEAQKKAEEVLGEAAVTLELSKLRSSSSNVTSGFVETFGIGVCKGKYSDILAKEWHRWDKIHNSENEPVDIFGDDQLYVVFVVANGGTDLEHFVPRSFDEVKSILLQVSLTLTVAEEACQFEHRDLHWGNILIRRDGTTDMHYKLRDVDISVACAGVRVTLIDFTLSRLKTKDGEVAYSDLATDPEIFNGPLGDPQAEAYRSMRRCVKKWSDFAPATNATWLHYLAEIISSHRCPKSMKNSEKKMLLDFKNAAAKADSAESLLWDPFFSGAWSSQSHTPV